MSNLRNAFTQRKALMAFITCGDPDLETTIAIAKAAVAGGANILELNIPFSDPTAADPVIQQSNVRALKNGVTTDSVFMLVQQLRKELSTPIVVSTYANVVFSYGAERFAAKCKETGIDGILIPDVPFEERQEFLPACQQAGVPLIYMLAVTSRERIRAIASEANGFLYIMACPGNKEQELNALAATVKECTDVPCLICLNGTDPARFSAVSQKVDGVTVDVPIVSIIEKQGANAPIEVQNYIRQFAQQL